MAMNDEQLEVEVMKLDLDARASCGKAHLEFGRSFG
jgi:hypothetical protein